jgi:hypothetical protein
MTHEDAGNYAKKHPAGTTVEAGIRARIREQASAGCIACAAAHRIAEELRVAPAQVGIGIDLLEYRIGGCQLGLFGHTPHKRVVTPAGSVAHDLQKAIEFALVDGRLPCADAWSIADRCGMSRLAVAGACEALAIKISACQLGAFR